MEGRKEEAGDEGVGVQGIAGEIGLGPATVLARVSRVGDSTLRISAITLIYG